MTAAKREPQNERSTAEPAATNSILATIRRLTAEGPIGMAAAARIFGSFRNGRPCHPSTLSRACLNGFRLSCGRTVRLEHFRLNGRLMTSEPAVLRFIAAQQFPEDETPPTGPRSPAERTRASEQAAAELEDFGI